MFIFSLILAGVSLVLSYIPANFMATRKTANILREE
jgi:hypothetical protein